MLLFIGGSRLFFVSGAICDLIMNNVGPCRTATLFTFHKTLRTVYSVSLTEAHKISKIVERRHIVVVIQERQSTFKYRNCSSISLLKVKQSRYRPGVAQRVPGS